jgi:hypothetical protein
VIELGDDHDLILGQNWMKREGAVISFPEQTCDLQRKDMMLDCIKATPTTKHNGPSVPRVTSIRAKRDIQKGAKIFHVRVTHSTENESDKTQTPPRPSESGNGVSHPTEGASDKTQTLPAPNEQTGNGMSHPTEGESDKTPPTSPKPRKQSEYGLVKEDIPSHVTTHSKTTGSKTTDSKTTGSKTTDSKITPGRPHGVDKPSGLPPERKVAHVIPLIPGSQPVHTALSAHTK